MAALAPRWGSLSGSPVNAYRWYREDRLADRALSATAQVPRRRTRRVPRLRRARQTIYAKSSPLRAAGLMRHRWVGGLALKVIRQSASHSMTSSHHWLPRKHVRGQTSPSTELRDPPRLAIHVHLPVQGAQRHEVISASVSGPVELDPWKSIAAANPSRNPLAQTASAIVHGGLRDRTEHKAADAT
jgi:hypothetical protein